MKRNKKNQKTPDAVFNTVFINPDIYIYTYNKYNNRRSDALITITLITAHGQLYCSYKVSNWFENHHWTTEDTNTVTNAPFIQNSNRMTFSVDCNRKFFKRILSTPVAFKLSSKLSGSKRCSDDKNYLDFSSIFIKIFGFCSSILLTL